MDEKALIAEYEKLRRKAHELFVQWNTIDTRLVEIERQLPDQYSYPGDPPLIEGRPSADDPQDHP